MNGQAELCYHADMNDRSTGRKLSALLGAASAVSIDQQAREDQVTGIAYDSRKVEPGNLFVAVRGLTTDGHDYLREAADNGAVAAIVEESDPALTGVLPQYKVSDTRAALALASAAFYDYPGRRLRLVAVTGTNGKTTTAHVIENILNAAGIPTGVLGTVEYRFGSHALPASRTTPESLDLQRTLSDMADEGATAAVMEASSHALHLGRLEGCWFETAVFTNLSPEHLDYHRDMDSYFEAKTKLFDSDAYHVRHFVVNDDDPYGKRLAETCDERRLTTFGRSPGCDVRLLDYSLSNDGTDLRVSLSGQTVELKTWLKGSFNVDNVLAAVASAFSMDVDIQSIVSGLESAKGIRGRFQSVDAGQDFQVIVDYAHTPDGLQKVLAAARDITKGRLITVFGCGGDRDRSKRPAMGAAVASLSDEYIVTSDNPRSEDPESIIVDILGGVGPGGGKGRTVIDRRSAINEAIAGAHAGDTVVIAGKGHEVGQIFADMTVPFDDIVVAEEALRATRGNRSAG